MRAPTPEEKLSRTAEGRSTPKLASMAKVSPMPPSGYTSNWKSTDGGATARRDVIWASMAPSYAEKPMRSKAAARRAASAAQASFSSRER